MTSLPLDLAPDALREESRALRSLSRALLGDAQDAEDVMQETWLKTLRGSGSDRQRGRSWRARVARNLAFRTLRRRMAQRRWELAAARPEAVPAAGELVERIDLHRKVVEVVLSLHEPYRRTVLLRFWEDLPPRQVAARMGVPVSTVRTRVRRALDTLRSRLDRRCGGRAVWCVPLVRWFEQVSPAQGVAAVLTGVVLMATKLKIAVAALGLAAVSWLTWEVAVGPGSGPAPNADGSEPAPTASLEVAEAGALDARAESLVREQAGAESEGPRAREELDRTPVLVEPYAVTVLVVDARGDPVPRAEVEVWDAVKHDRSPPGQPEATGYTGDRLGSHPFLRRETDMEGRSTFTLDRHFVFLCAHKEGIGSSNDRPWGATRNRRAREVVIALEPDVQVRGLVLAEDGVPVGNAEVSVGSGMIVGNGVEYLRAPSPTRSDAAGRFELGLRPRNIHVVHARHGERYVEQDVSTLTSDDKELVLRFPGALSIRGFLLDPAGKAVAGGRIRAWETIEPGPEHRPWVTSAETAQDGSFQLLVERQGQYRLVGRADGHANSELTPVSVTDVRPHADVVLRLLEPATIAGVVEDEDGDPLPGVLLFLAAETGEEPYYADRPTRHDLFGRVGSVRSAQDGSFAFEGVHPGTTYTLACRPHDELPNLTVRRYGVRAGNRDVLVAITGAERKGSSISGTVIDDVSGEPVELTEVKLVRYQQDGTAWGPSDVDAVIEAGRYTVPALSLGVQYGLVLKSVNHPPVFVGPVTTVQAVEVLDARLRAWGRIVCHLVDQNGQPVVNEQVIVRPTAPEPADSHPGAPRTNAEGRIERRLSPGRYEVYVLAHDEKVVSEEVDVAPGGTRELRLTIPR